MDKLLFSKINFENYIVKKIVFQLNTDFDFSEDMELDLKFDNDIQIDMENKTSVIGLTCTIFEEFEKNNYPYYINIEMAGFFRFESSLQEKEVKSLLEVNGTSIIFPYMRNIISSITTNASLPPLIIPTLNIANYFKQKSK